MSRPSTTVPSGCDGGELSLAAHHLRAHQRVGGDDRDRDVDLVGAELVFTSRPFTLTRGSVVRVESAAASSPIWLRPSESTPPRERLDGHRPIHRAGIEEGPAQRRRPARERRSTCPIRRDRRWR